MLKYYSPPPQIQKMIQAYMDDGWTWSAAVRQVEGEEAIAMDEYNSQSRSPK